ncbi:reverse transcriptase domain-containing protein [Tanacetum coccineum]
MNVINMSMRPVQVNTKCLNSLPPEWSKFVSDVKLARDLHTTNYDQLYSYLEQHERHVNETRLMRERYQDPLAFSHQTTSVSQIAYTSPQPSIQPLIEFPQLDSGLVVPVFNQGDDPIACLNKAMAFLTVVASSRFPSTNNQIRNSSNPRNQATIQDGEGHMARQCTQPKRPRNAAWFKEKAMLAEAQEAGQILNEEQLAFLADLGIPNSQTTQTTIPNIVAFQTEDLDAYDSDCDDVSNVKAVLMANLSSYGSDVLSDVPHSDSYHNDMDNEIMHAMQDFEQTPVERNNESLTTKLERYKERVKTFEQRLNIDLSTREKMIDSQMDDMIKEKHALKQQINSLEQNLSNQIKEKESLLQIITVFKNESKEKESKYMDKEIDLEKKIKELDNIVYKVGQSAQTVHMLTKPQVFYDDTHKQVLGYQNPFYLKKAQRIKPTLYDGSVISKHVASLVFDDDGTLILE